MIIITYLVENVCFNTMITVWVKKHEHFDLILSGQYCILTNHSKIQDIQASPKTTNQIIVTVGGLVLAFSSLHNNMNEQFLSNAFW